jgi:predicted XRE-type DNA-binding protein
MQKPTMPIVARDEMTTRRTEVYEGDPNVYAELGLPDADAHFLKAQIVAELFRLVKEKKLTQTKAGTRMGISQPEVSRMFKGHFREYSVERLIGFLTAFERDVEIVVKPRAKDGSRGHVTFRQAPA